MLIGKVTMPMTLKNVISPSNKIDTGFLLTLSGPYLYCFFPTREGAIVKEYNLVNPHSFLKGMKKRGCEA